MPVLLSTSILGNEENLLTLGGAGELMAWFYPHKDHPQHVESCVAALYLGHGGQGFLNFLHNAPFLSTQRYLGDSDVLQTEICGHGLRIVFTDTLADDAPVLRRQIRVENVSDAWKNGGLYHLGHFKMGGFREGNSLSFDFKRRILTQNHREAALCVAGDALAGHHVGKAGANWGNNARYALEKGVLASNALEIGDVNFAAGFYFELNGGEASEKTLLFALGATPYTAREHLETASLAAPPTAPLENGKELDELDAAFRRCLRALPMLKGKEGVAVAAPEFDPEFISCGGYGYFWPRDGAEYVAGLLDAGQDQPALAMFDWCARHQDASGLWHQRYFLNGVPGPNWCLPPDALQIDQVGAVGWAYGKFLDANPDFKVPKTHETMLVLAADYLLSRLDEKTGVHRNAFDTWETFIGSFSYSNAAIYAHFLATHRVTRKRIYLEAAQRVKNGVLTHFVRELHDGTPYLVRGFREDGTSDETVDSASLGAIEPFGLLDLNVPRELEITRGTLRAVTEKLETGWMGGRAIRRFEGDEYVGGVPACVNTLWMARCCLHIAQRTGETEWVTRAEGFLRVVLKRATPTLLLPELMQGPNGESYWAAPHGWAMSSFVSGYLKLQETKAQFVLRAT